MGLKIKKKMVNKTPHIRAFIAISLPEEIKDDLGGLQTQLRKSGIKASWTHPDTLHLTLKFLGNTNIGQIEKVKMCMENAVKAIPRHRLSASGIGAFPSVKNPRIIWAGIDGQTDVVKKMANHLEEGLYDEFGFKKEKKMYFPHLTLARTKQPVFKKRMVRLQHLYKSFQSKDFLVSKISLYQSELRSSGAVHIKIFSTSFLN